MSAGGFAGTNASSNPNRSPRAGDTDILEVVARQPRQHIRVDFILSKISLVLVEA